MMMMMTMMMMMMLMMMMVVMMMRKTIQRDWKENMHTKVVRQCLQACK